MKSLQNYIDQIKLLTNDLILVATKLRNMSLQVVSEEELTVQQQREEELLMQIEKIDEEIQKNYKDQLSPEFKKEFHEKLLTFQELNQEYIQNLKASHGLIQFELQRLKHPEARQLPQLSSLKKTLSSPNGSQAIKSQENKET